MGIVHGPKVETNRLKDGGFTRISLCLSYHAGRVWKKSRWRASLEITCPQRLQSALILRELCARRSLYSSSRPTTEEPGGEMKMITIECYGGGVKWVTGAVIKDVCQ